jgi:hypothetical protein
MMLAQVCGCNVRFPPIADIRCLAKLGEMKWKLLSLAAFVAWEAWWAYVYFSAPTPDPHMDTVGAILMGIGVPLWLLIVVGGTVWMSSWIKRSVQARRRR